MNDTGVAIQARASKVQSMFGSIAHRYDLGNTVLSFGVHHYWRRRVMRLITPLEQGCALDVATGTGDFLPLLRRTFGGEVIGLDFCYPMLENAKKKEQVLAAKAPLIQGDGLQLPFAADTFNCITVSFGVRNFADLKAGLSELRRVLKPGGQLMILEFGQPSLPVFASFYRWYSAVLMPAIGGLVTGNKEAYVYLPETASEFPCGSEFEAVLEAVGLRSQRTLCLTAGIAYAYLSTKQ